MEIWNNGTYNCRKDAFEALETYKALMGYELHISGDNLNLKISFKDTDEVKHLIKQLQWILEDAERSLFLNKRKAPE